MKEVNINLRLSETLKEKFYIKCEEMAQTPSAVLRLFMAEYIEHGMSIFKEVK